MTRFGRLSADDLSNLAVEATDTPMHVGALLVLDGRTLLDIDGTALLAEIRSAIEAGLDRVPLLRTVIYRPGPFAGRPLWADDPAFRVDRHVDQIRLSPPGDEEQLLRLTERLMQPRLDRAHPLWQVWVVTGLPDRRLAVVVKLHHAVADGLTALRLVATLLDRPVPEPAPAGSTWTPAPPPRWAALCRDNLSGHARAAARLPRRLADRRAWQRAGRSARAGWLTLTRAHGAPRTSLNAPIGPHRRMAVIRMDLAAAKAVGHRHRATVNDLVLSLIAGGLRGLLLSRGEAVDRVALRATVAVSLRTAADDGTAGNRTGGLVVRLPVAAVGPEARLELVRQETATAKRDQAATAEPQFVQWLARSGLIRAVTRHQHITNLIESNVTGPADEIRVLGAPVLDLIPIGVLAGNLTIAFLAFSYHGRLTVTVWCDADRYPDLAVLVEAMNRDWASLSGPGSPRAGPIATPGRAEGP
jgi:diacylglycerol O-acyltransferase / wax synthase